MVGGRVAWQCGSAAVAVWLQLGRSAVAKAQKVEASSLVATRRVGRTQNNRSSHAAAAVWWLWLFGWLVKRGGILWRTSRQGFGHRGCGATTAGTRERERERDGGEKQPERRGRPKAACSAALTLPLLRTAPLVLVVVVVAY